MMSYQKKTLVSFRTLQRPFTLTCIHPRPPRRNGMVTIQFSDRLMKTRLFPSASGEVTSTTGMLGSKNVFIHETEFEHEDNMANAISDFYGRAKSLVKVRKQTDIEHVLAL